MPLPCKTPCWVESVSFWLLSLYYVLPVIVFYLLLVLTQLLWLKISITFHVFCHLDFPWMEECSFHKGPHSGPMNLRPLRQSFLPCSFHHIASTWKSESIQPLNSLHPLLWIEINCCSSKHHFIYIMERVSRYKISPKLLHFQNLGIFAHKMRLIISSS